MTTEEVRTSRELPTSTPTWKLKLVDDFSVKARRTYELFVFLLRFPMFVEEQYMHLLPETLSYPILAISRWIEASICLGHTMVLSSLLIGTRSICLITWVLKWTAHFIAGNAIYHKEVWRSMSTSQKVRKSVNASIKSTEDFIESTKESLQKESPRGDLKSSTTWINHSRSRAGLSNALSQSRRKQSRAGGFAQTYRSFLKKQVDLLMIE